MAEANFTHDTIICRNFKSDEALVQEGAKAAITALQELESISKDPGFIECTVEEGVNAEAQRRQAAVQAVMGSIGDLPPRQRGFVMAMAEYIHEGAFYGESPRLEAWMPEASMTSDELKVFRGELLSTMPE